MIVVHQVYNNHTTPLHKGWVPQCMGPTPCKGVLYDCYYYVLIIYTHHIMVDIIVIIFHQAKQLLFPGQLKNKMKVHLNMLSCQRIVIFFFNSKKIIRFFFFLRKNNPVVDIVKSLG
jgi:hypothetical protein